MNKIWLNLATLGPIGYLPAPGTMATLVTLLLVYALHVLHLSVTYYGFIVALLTIIGSFIITRALALLDRHDDPSEIVFDELLGTLLVFLAVPLNMNTVIIGFFLFRFLDITKILGISSCELLLGAWGIILDDLLAAIMTNIVLQLLVAYSLI